MRRACWLLIFFIAGCVGIADGDGALDGGLVRVMPAAGGGGGFVEVDGPTNDGGAQDSGVSDAGPTNPCTGFVCGAGSHCELTPLRCICNPGYVADGGTCTPGDPGVPELRTQTQVCDAWKKGRATTTNEPFTKTTATCDPGVLTRAGVDDTLARLNMFRWLVGLGPVSDSVSENDKAQKCSLVSAWNPAGQQAHNPPSDSTCYTTEGAAGAGSSNIAWGSGTPQNAVDQWLEDFGNFSHMGHRRWLLNPPLGPVGIGFYAGGNNFGSASCMTVFGGSGGGPRPEWWALPPPGFVPQGGIPSVWSVHGKVGGGLDAGVTRMSDNAPLAVQLDYMVGGYGNHSAITLTRQGWAPAVGETYRIQVTGPDTNIQYEVKPVNCP